MNIKKLFDKTYHAAVKRGWEYIYIAIDVHDTIIPSTYSLDSDITVYNYTIDALMLMSKYKGIKLILYTSTKKVEIDRYLDFFKNNNIHFDFINCNPDVENTEYGDFSTKFYFNILLDDKAGFEPNEDWFDLLQYLKKY